MSDHRHDDQVAAFGECIDCATRSMGPGRRARDAAMAQVDAAADADWAAEARIVVAALARKLGEFTTDDVWARLPTTRERRALGPVMAWAADAGLIVRTDRTVPSSRPEAHAGPKRVWRSTAHQPDLPSAP